MAQIEVYLSMFFTIFVGRVKSSFCYVNGYADTVYCEYYCCGPSGYQYCCNSYFPSTISYRPSTISDSPSTVYNGYLGSNIGIVVGSLAGLGILVGIIDCCCRHQCTGGTSGQVLRPHTNPAFSMATAITTTTGTQMPMTHLSPGMNVPSYPTFQQMAGGYSPSNETMNYPYGAPLSMDNAYGAQPPSYDEVVRKDSTFENGGK